MQAAAASVCAVAANDQQDVTFVGEFDRISEKVRENLAQANRISDDSGRRIGRNVADELQTLLMRADGQSLQDVAREISDRNGDRFHIELARLDLREVEDVVEDSQQTVG